MENYLNEQGLNTYDTQIKSYIRGVMSERSEIPSSQMAVINGIDNKVDTVDGKCDQILTAVSSDDVQGSKITINLVSEGFNVSYVLATSGNKVLGQLQNGDSVIIPFGAEYELTPHLSNGTDKFPKRGIATKMEETVTVYGSGYDRVDLGLPSGKLWAASNLGADSPEKRGLFGIYSLTTAYTSGEEFSSISYSSNISGTSVDVARAQMGGSWKLPTSSNWSELNTYCTAVTCIYNGVEVLGMVGPNGNTLLIPAVSSPPNTVSAFSYYMSGTAVGSSTPTQHYSAQVIRPSYYTNTSGMQRIQLAKRSHSSKQPVRAVMDAPSQS